LEMAEQLGALQGVGRGSVERRRHVQEPPFAFERPDPPLHMPGAKARVTSLLVVGPRAAPELGQEKAEVPARRTEVFGVEGAQDVVAGDALVEALNQPFEEGHAAEAVVKPRCPVQGQAAYDSRVASRARIRAVVAVATLGMLASGCGGTAPNAAASVAAKQTFLNSVYGQAPDISSYRTATQLVNMGQAVCTDLSSGASIQEVADRLPLTEGTNPLTATDLGVVIFTAVKVFCPKYKKLISG
jgi:hypothetical protein